MRALSGTMVVVLVIAASTAATVEPAAAETPTITVTATEVEDGGTVGLDVTGFPTTGDGLWSAFQCASSIESNPRPTLDETFASCRATGGGGTGSVPAHVEGQVFESFQAGASTVRCSTDPGGCVMAVGMVDSSFQPIGFATAPIIVRPSTRTLAISPTAVPNGGSVSVSTTGWGSDPASIGVCGAGIAPDPTTEYIRYSCRTFQSWATGLPETTTIAVPWSWVSDNGSVRDCANEGSCAIAAWVTDGDRVIRFRSVPVELTTDPVVTGEPTSDLVAGDIVKVDATGLSPDVDYLADVCWRFVEGQSIFCEPTPWTTFRPDQDGNLVIDVPVPQSIEPVVGPRRHCRDDCSIRLTAPPLSATVGLVDFTMSAGSVTASPSTGLVDGQPVTVTGTGLQPTYEGPMRWLPTGGWAVAQCDASIGPSPNLVQILTRCGTPTGAGPIQVPGATAAATATVDAQARLSLTLGGTLDCTTGPDACTIGLLRWEEDAQVSAVLTPITFG